MRRRIFAGLWVLVGIAVWNGFFDLYVSRGAREYGQKQAEADLGLSPHVSMSQVMNDAKHDGLVAASLWATGVVLCGWATAFLVGGPRPSRQTGEAPEAAGPRR